jgi:hypothetical protein
VAEELLESDVMVSVFYPNDKVPLITVISCYL